MLQTAQTGLARMALTDARSRLAGLLLDLGRRHGKPTAAGMTCPLSLSRAELGAMIGLTPETTMRLLSEFRGEGIVLTDGRTLTLTQPDRLEGLA